MTDNLTERVGILETKVTYLESGHNEMKSILKGLEGMPYDIRGIGQKLDTVIDQQKELKVEMKQEIKDIEDRMDCIEDNSKPHRELPKFLGLERSQIYDIIKWTTSIILVIAGIYAKMHGLDITPFIGGV